MRVGCDLVEQIEHRPVLGQHARVHVTRAVPQGPRDDHVEQFAAQTAPLVRVVDGDGDLDIGRRAPERTAFGEADDLIARNRD